jgi:S-layer family protein
MHRRFSLRWAAALVVVFSLAIPGLALANHNFADVPTSAFYHNAVEWVFNRGITAGCGGGNYCPNNAVTRGEMAVFLRAEGNALTPRFLTQTEGPAVLDLSTQPVWCVTAAYTPTFPETARVDSWVAMTSTNSMGFFVRNVYSTNGGVGWNNLDAAVVGRATVPAGGWATGVNNALLDLAPGTQYMWGIQVGRIAGTDDPTSARCESLVEVVNRNPATSPL